MPPRPAPPRVLFTGAIRRPSPRDPRIASAMGWVEAAAG